MIVLVYAIMLVSRTWVAPRRIWSDAESGPSGVICSEQSRRQCHCMASEIGDSIYLQISVRDIIEGMRDRVVTTRFAPWSSVCAVVDLSPRPR
jgi:hypothetical protein